MIRKGYNLTLRQKIAMIFRLMGKGHIPYKTNFLKYHLIRRKYILSRTSEFFGRDKFSPAPLLNKKILDVGCGFNHIADELAFRGGDVLAIDKDMKVIESARNDALHNGSPVNYRHKWFEELDSTEELFDIVLLLDCIKENNTQEMIKKAKSLLKDDGLVIVSGSNKSMKSLFRNVFIAKFLLKMRYLNIKATDLVSLKSIKNALRGQEFDILHVQGVDFNFFTGKWHKTKSTKMRYIMHACKKEVKYESAK
jgi:ubiquinone biosynthesis O-methyltransferase